MYRDVPVRTDVEPPVRYRQITRESTAMGRAMRLTEARIRSLTSQGREYKEYFHEPTPSAGIRIYRGGRKVFFLYYRRRDAETTPPMPV